MERPVHSHTKVCELLLCYEGEGVYFYDTETYPVQAGDLLFCNAGKEHELLRSPGKELGVYCFGFVDVNLKDLPENSIISKNGRCICPSGSNFTLLKEMAEKIAELDIGVQSDLFLSDLLFSAFFALAENIQKEYELRLESFQTSGRDTELSEKVKNYIAEHLAEKVSVERMAEDLGYSTSCLAHGFKKETGYSPIEYLIRRRIGYAESLLIASEFSVGHIASMCGYASSSYFQTSFRKIAGISPMQYRKKYREELQGSKNQL